MGGGARGRLRLSERVQKLEASLARQAVQISDLERVAPKEFEVVHYNVLSDQASSNFNPWFLYGANVCAPRQGAAGPCDAVGTDAQSRARCRSRARSEPS